MAKRTAPKKMAFRKVARAGDAPRSLRIENGGNTGVKFFQVFSKLIRIEIRQRLRVFEQFIERRTYSFILCPAEVRNGTLQSQNQSLCAAGLDWQANRVVDA